MEALLQVAGPLFCIRLSYNGSGKGFPTFFFSPSKNGLSRVFPFYKHPRLKSLLFDKRDAERKQTGGMIFKGIYLLIAPRVSRPNLFPLSSLQAMP
ncbi:hypothetical protein [Melaminivora alkalimesophila]|uniref:hypothetical protein n=1 Tax=Melaminivora alkalimesophila TaxID=1165852 RepID=UPI0011B72EFA|nr:hypothetical protein [Melaminivora alkalimesophila]